MGRRRNRWMGPLAALVLTAGCGGGVSAPEPRNEVEPFVGTWDAVEFVVTNTADTTVVADLLLEGSFNIVIQPSGLYTATLVLGGLTPFVEIGQLQITGNVLTLSPNGPNPCPGSSVYAFDGPTRLTLDGPTCFDFNLDGEAEDALAHIELLRR